MSLEILLVEDQPADVLLTQRALERAGLHNAVRVAKNGTDALAQLIGVEPDTLPGLVLLDLGLPGAVDGHDVMRRMREDTAARDIPVIILTTSEEDADLLKSYELSAQGFVRKPLDTRDFFTIVGASPSLALEIVPPHKPRG